MVPEDYMAEESSFTERIIGDLKLVEGDQVKLDQVYAKLCESLRNKYFELKKNLWGAGAPLTRTTW